MLMACSDSCIQQILWQFIYKYIDDNFLLQLFQKVGLPNTDGFCTAFHDMEFKLLCGNPCTTEVTQPSNCSLVVFDKNQTTPWKAI